MFKKSFNKRNLRTKRRSGEESGSEADEPTSTVTNRSSSTAKSTHPQPSIESVPSSSSLLSFKHDEDDDEDVVPVFQVKKSSHSRRMEKFRKKIEKDRKYDDEPEDLSPPRRENKKEKRRSPDSTVKADTPPNQVRIEEADSSTVDVEDLEPESEDLSRFGSSGRSTLGAFKSVFSDGAIPDAKMVYRARKQRQRAREGEVIPVLDDTQRFRNEKSRLIREDDDERSDESGEEGGQFFSKQMLTLDEEERRKTQAQFLAVEQGDSDKESSDEELQRWEQEQMRKGVSLQQMSTYQQEQLSYFQSKTPDNVGSNGFSGRRKYVLELDESREPEPMEIEVEDAKASAAVPKIGGGPVVNEKLPSVTLSDIVSKLSIRLEESEQMKRARYLELQKIEDHLAENEATIAKLEEAGPTARQHYVLYQELLAYVRDVLDCLDEKVPQINKSDESMTKLYTSRSDFFVRRRRQDVKDQFEKCSALVSGRSNDLKQDPDTIMRAAEREARRTRRRQAREKCQTQAGHHDGLSSDDEETPSRIAAFVAEKDTIIAESDDILSDALDEFISIESITARLLNWLAVDQNSFEDAYVSLCVPKLLAPIIRVQLFAWNPIEANSVRLESMRWFSSVLRVGEGEMTQQHASVSSLLPTVVQKVIVPRLAGLVENVWDPVSSAQTERLADFVKELSHLYPTINAESKQIQALLGAFQAKIRSCLDEDLFMPIYAKEAIENTNTGARAFLDRQFWTAVKVLRNLIKLEGFLSRSLVQEFVIDGIINRQIVLGLQCSVFSHSATIVKCRSVVDCLPHSWLANNRNSPDSLAQLQPLCKVLCRIAEEVNSSDSGNARDTVKDVYKMLQKLGARSQANRLLERTAVQL